MKRIKMIVMSLAIMAGLGLAVAQPSFAATCNGAKACINEAIDDTKGANNDDLSGLIKNIINILLFIVGAAAVIMIIFGGIKYVLSAGDQSSVTAAKNTILYAVVGLVVASLAFAIVNFVVRNL